jgi:hypothetical protein
MSREQLMVCKEFVFSNLLANAQALSANSFEEGPAQTPEGIAAVEYFESEGNDAAWERTDCLQQDLVTHLRNLWADPGIQVCYSNRCNFQLNDTCKYFFERLPVIAEPDYCPDVNDFLRVRIRTTGIVEHKFTIDEVQFQMYDVGGQRNERKKWIHCFQNVQAVLFVAALSEFDQFLYEEDTADRMTEAFALFDEISNLEVFEACSIILFLNKRDLFAEKILTKKISESPCQELQQIANTQIDQHDFEQASNWIQERFIRKYKGDRGKIFPHKTCATDTNTMSVVFNTVKSIIIANAMGQSGLLDC